MKFECEACGHLGAAASVTPSARGVVLVCAQCAHENLLGGASPAPAVVEPSASSQAPSPGPAPATSSSPALTEGVKSKGRAASASPMSEAQAAALASTMLRGHQAPAQPSMMPKGPNPSRVRVEVGEGDVRCPKCGFRQDTLDACRQCGVDIRRLGTSVERFERVPPQKRSAARSLDARWEALIEGGGILETSACESFINLASAAGLLDRAARRFRFYAQDHDGTPEGDAAVVALGRLVDRMHAEFITSQGGVNAKDRYTEKVRQLRTALYVLTAAFCLVIVVLALMMFGPF